MPDPVSALPFAWGGPAGRGRIRIHPEDFVVIEETGLEAAGRGGYLLVRLEKRGLDTHDVAARIAKIAGVKPQSVNWAGRKDRHAVTVQIFSLPLRGREPDLSVLDGGRIRVLEQTRHDRPLRPGDLEGNHFRLRVRKFQGDACKLAELLQRIAAGGVPNYFGPQRFGRDGGNLERAAALFRGEAGRVGRQERGMWLSAARALLFNRVLAARVEGSSWNSVLPGEMLQLTRGGALTPVFDPAAARAEVAGGRAWPTGPLWGRSGPVPEPRGEAAALEREALAHDSFWKEGLERFGLKRDRRALGCAVEGLEWSLEKNELLLRFRLGAGSYATSVLRELVETG